MNVATDLEGVREIDRDAFPGPGTAEMFLREAGRKNISHVYVVRKPGAAVVGYCAFWVVADELQIHNLAVHQDWRRLGAGTALLEYTMSAASRLGAQSATLEVRASNAAARRLYEQAGFRVVGLRERYYSGPVDDALVLWRESLGSLETVSAV
jgi:ribosomal-protein-alanine N-acetyltransferase